MYSKWKQTGYKLRLSVTSGMQLVGEHSEQIYVVVEVVNIGDKKTELTHVVGLLHKSHLQRYRGKNERSFLVPKPSLSGGFPCFLEPGQRWMGGINQTEELEIMSRSGLLYCGVFHSGSKKPLTARLIIKAKT